MARFSSSVVAAAANVGGQSPRRGRFWHPGSYKICSSFFQKLAMRAINHQDMECEHGETNWWRALWYLKTFCHGHINPPKKTYHIYSYFSLAKQVVLYWFLDRKSWHLKRRDDLLLSIDTRDSPPRLCFLVSKAYELQLEISSVNPSPILVGGFKHEFLG